METRTLEELHKILEKTPAIYVRSKILNSSKTLEEFLINFFDRTTPTTYERNGEVQCGPGTGRSFGDLFAIIRVVFPETTPSGLGKCLMALGKKGYINTVLCGKIQGVAFHSQDKHAGIGHNRMWINLVGEEENDGIGAFGFKEIIKLINEKD